MRVHFDPSPLRDSEWYGHVLRFAVGGAVTALTGVVAKLAGPEVGGLFLALPAIFPAGVALIAKLQNEKAGPRGRGDRGRRAAAVEAAGASAGSIGLVAFAVVAWQALAAWPAWAALTVAGLAWAVAAGGAWIVRKARRHR